MPADGRVRGSQQPLGEKDVDKVQDQDAGRGEDGRGDGDAHVVWIAGPNDSHDHGHDAGHAKAEHGARHDELVATAIVELEDGHVEGGGAYEDDEEDGGDGDVDRLGGRAAERGALWREWAMLWIGVAGKPSGWENWGGGAVLGVPAWTPLRMVLRSTSSSCPPLLSASTSRSYVLSPSGDRAQRGSSQSRAVLSQARDAAPLDDKRAKSASNKDARRLSALTAGGELGGRKRADGDTHI